MLFYYDQEADTGGEARVDSTRFDCEFRIVSDLHCFHKMVLLEPQVLRAPTTTYSTREFRRAIFLVPYEQPKLFLLVYGSQPDPRAFCRLNGSTSISQLLPT